MEIFAMSAAGIYDWPIIKQVSWLLGQVMNGIYNALAQSELKISVWRLSYLRLSYIRFFCFTIKQQKFTKMSAVMQPEIQKIQKDMQIKGSGFHAETAGRDEYGLR